MEIIQSLALGSVLKIDRQQVDGYQGYIFTYQLLLHDDSFFKNWCQSYYCTTVYILQSQASGVLLIMFLFRHIQYLYNVCIDWWTKSPSVSWINIMFNSNNASHYTTINYECKTIVSIVLAFNHSIWFVYDILWIFPIFFFLPSSFCLATPLCSWTPSYFSPWWLLLGGGVLLYLPTISITISTFIHLHSPRSSDHFWALLASYVHHPAFTASFPHQVYHYRCFLCDPTMRILIKFITISAHCVILRWVSSSSL